MNGGIQPGTYVGSSMYDGAWLAEFAGRVAKANVTEYGASHSLALRPSH